MIEILSASIFSIVLSGAVGDRIETTCGASPTIAYMHDPLPIKRVRPVYPRRAITRSIGGKVTLTFDISAGVPTDIQIVSSRPPNMFDVGALRAVAEWRFESAEPFGSTTITYKTESTASCFMEDA